MGQDEDWQKPVWPVHGTATKDKRVLEKWGGWKNRAGPFAVEGGRTGDVMAVTGMRKG